MVVYSKYPGNIDDSSTLPISTDLISPVNAEVVNRLRSGIINIESTLGIDPQGTFGTVKDRLDALEISTGGGGGGGGGGISGTVCWGSIHLTSGSVSLLNGFNVLAIQRLSLGQVKITFATAITVSYSVVSSTDTDGGTCSVSAKTSNSFIIDRANATGSSIDDDFSFVVLSNVSSPVPTPDPMVVPVSNLFGNITAQNDYYYMAIDTSSVAANITLPASPSTGKVYIIKDISGNASSNHIVISGNGHNIDGTSTYLLFSNFSSATLIFNGTVWSVV